MAVDAVVANVELSSEKPFRVGRLPLVELVPGLEERDPFRLVGPELVEALLVDVRLGVGLLAERRVGWVAALFDLKGLDGMAAGRHITHRASLEQESFRAD